MYITEYLFIIAFVLIQFTRMSIGDLIGKQPVSYIHFYKLNLRSN